MINLVSILNEEYLTVLVQECNPPIKKAQSKVENSHKLTKGELL